MFLSVFFDSYWMRTQGNGLVCHGILVYRNIFLSLTELSNGVLHQQHCFLYIYIDKLLIKLKESGYGCYLNGIYMGALAIYLKSNIQCI